MAATVSPYQPSVSASPSSRTLLIGIGLSSYAALLLELALTRLFSVVLFYHFAFLAISIALSRIGGRRSLRLSAQGAAASHRDPTAGSVGFAA